MWCVAAPGPSGPTEESEEAGTEVPGAVTVEVEEIHPLPEVSTAYIPQKPNTIINPRWHTICCIITAWLFKFEYLRPLFLCSCYNLSYFVLQNFFGEKDEFLLFASLFEVTMIDPIIGSKPVTFELSIGNTVTFCPLFQDKKLDISAISAKLIRNHLTITYVMKYITEICPWWCSYIHLEVLQYRLTFQCP